jgi:hypothetical protein
MVFQSDNVNEHLGTVDYERWTQIAMSLELIILRIYIDGVNAGQRTNVRAPLVDHPDAMHHFGDAYSGFLYSIEFS